MPIKNCESEEIRAVVRTVRENHLFDESVAHFLETVEIEIISRRSDGVFPPYAVEVEIRHVWERRKGRERDSFACEGIDEENRRRLIDENQPAERRSGAAAAVGGFREGQAVVIVGQGVEEAAAIGGAAQWKHEPWEFAREIGRGYWGSAPPVVAGGAEADVVGESGEVCGDDLEELRREVRPVNGGGVVGHQLRTVVVGNFTGVDQSA